MYTNPNLLLSPAQLINVQSKTINHRSPSNIALIKYWGKFGRQYPKNASLSITLSKAYTDTQLCYQAKENASDAAISLEFLFEDKPNALFAKKISKFLVSITDIFPFLTQIHLQIQSHNSFPHSSGIASSASSMAALSLCLCALERQLFGTLASEADFLRKASYIARLGSGSAARSVYPKMAVWGQTDLIPHASNDYAIPFYDRLHPVFEGYKDAILIVSREEKKVSSRAGHALMNTHPFASIRYKQSNRNMSELIIALETGDLDVFVRIVEMEALTLHALMMTSQPAYLLMLPETLAIIQKIQTFRATTKVPVCFTLDAGPNVHVLYPAHVCKEVESFIEQELLPFCDNAYWIKDEMAV